MQLVWSLRDENKYVLWQCLLAVHVSFALVEHSPGCALFVKDRQEETTSRNSTPDKECVSARKIGIFAATPNSLQRWQSGEAQKNNEHILGNSRDRV